MKRFGVAIVLVVIIGIFIIIFFQSRDVQPVPQQQTSQQTSLRELVTDPSIGPREAPITIIMVGSFTCPVCKDASKTLDQLRALYSNQVRIVWKDLPESTGDAYTSAVAARCAQRQGKFWQYHDMLFDRQGVVPSDEIYTAWAGQIGIKESYFSSCLKNRETASLVDENINETLTLNTPSIPYFEISGQGIEGAPSLTFLRGRVDALLQSKAMVK